MNKGCELCGDFPAVLSSKCHPTAPLRIELEDSNILVAYCYVPQCNREVARFTLSNQDIYDGIAQVLNKSFEDGGFTETLKVIRSLNDYLYQCRIDLGIAELERRKT